MKKWLVALIFLGTLAAVPQAFGQVPFTAAPVGYSLTTDLLWLANKDFQLELASTLSARSVWSVRFGYTAHRAGSGKIGDKYSNGKSHWALGFRYRHYLLARAPHLLFIGVGYDNRPQDNMIGPLVELGATVNIKPVTVCLLYAAGYEFYLYNSPYDQRFVHGPEVRIGICF